MGKTPGAGGVALGSWPAGIACGHSSAEGLSRHETGFKYSKGYLYIDRLQVRTIAISPRTQDTLGAAVSGGIFYGLHLREFAHLGRSLKAFFRRFHRVFHAETAHVTRRRIRICVSRDRLNDRRRYHFRLFLNSCLKSGIESPSGDQRRAMTGACQ